MGIARAHGEVAQILFDDGKANALSPQMIEAFNGALDRAEADGGVLLLTGREGVFCGGFDLKVLQAGGPTALGMLKAGFELSARLLAHPTPVVLACAGHAMAMGVFLVLSADYRVGITGPFRYQANEVAMGMTMPHAAAEICRQRLTPAHFERVVTLSEAYSPEAAVAAGILDRVVSPESLMEVAMAHASGLATLNMSAHARTKKRVRAATLAAIAEGISADMRDLAAMGQR